MRPFRVRPRTDAVLPLNLDIFGEFSFFEKEPTLQKEKSQNPDLPESPCTEAILKARFRLIFLENPFFHPLGKADEAWLPGPYHLV